MKTKYIKISTLISDDSVAKTSLLLAAVNKMYRLKDKNGVFSPCGRSF